MNRIPLSLAATVGIAVLLVDLVKGDSLRDAIISAVVIAVVGFAFLWVVREIENRNKPPK